MLHLSLFSILTYLNSLIVLSHINLRPDFVQLFILIFQYLLWLGFLQRYGPAVMNFLSRLLETRLTNAVGHVFFYCKELLIFSSSVALVWIFNTRGLYNLITKEVNIPINLVPFFNNDSFLFYRFLKSAVTNELKRLLPWKNKKVRVIYSKQDKILLLLIKC